MYAASPDWMRVVMGDNVKLKALLEYTTFSSTYRRAVGDAEIRVGSDVYAPDNNMAVSQRDEYTGVGTARFTTIADVSKKPWFVDAQNNFKVASAQLKIMWTAHDPQNGVWLPPLQEFECVGDPDGSAFERNLITVNWIDVWGARTDKFWLLSRASQRRIDPQDTSLDRIGRHPPSGGVG